MFSFASILFLCFCVSCEILLPRDFVKTHLKHLIYDELTLTEIAGKNLSEEISGYETNTILSETRGLVGFYVILCACISLVLLQLLVL